ncbi:ribosome maturation factor RimP [Mycobacteroides chelonae]|jgi:ribosome maturation factor RimP|uniref:Ribosome maturation factor RimP n=1 Tax=Mycobacteroides chelonae TaxID=1774 RepID=A0AB73MFQ9_MYCCH|nr:ribosome maturation factor RimP [Mycobacteroides chelonae]MBF9326407.1 ribosome maturation factor RimP [Mycobacteroides chelonae]MBF9420583.1 ribosome maturation factor RimP [Mycobacteroides chelonae]MBF9438756.1 ribosome maturation factor RimP [Mycobacteroides chelonae]MBV6360361.1 ribosome maturation factor RimP [Mycobacteroides chelonae]MEC4834053.1 ribosome maturation factor RimP [Mycobacteroides chelonae]
MGLPSDDQVIELLGPEFSRSGVEIESVVVNEATVPARITVVVDSDSPVDLDAVAALSRTASGLLDEADTGWEAYDLEITTPGVDRPLTTPAHFRRAHGRLAQIRLTDGEDLLGRIGIANDDGIQVVLRKPVKGTGWTVRDLAFSDIESAVVQVEFTTPNPQELNLAGAAETGGGA